MKYFFLVVLFFLMNSIVNGQTSSSTLNSAGNSSNFLNITYEWSVGEMTLVETMIGTENILTNGLLQPFKIVPLGILNGFAISPNNILTSNGDGENDTWEIEFLDQYPDNEVSIYDRLGRRVFYAKNYKGSWDGKMDGNILPEDTYYYIIKITKNSQTGLKKGFLTILKD